MTNQESQIINQKSAEPLGELWVGDQLYNALHGAGDISMLHKIAVCNVMHDYYHPACKFVSPEQETLHGYIAGRDDIIHIVTGCLKSVPGCERILERWCDQVKTEFDHRLQKISRKNGQEA